MQGQISDREALARAAAVGKVHPRSLTPTADAVFVATDAGLVQFGGVAGEHGLTGPISRDESVYVYAFGPADHGNLEAFAERIDRSFFRARSVPSRPSPLGIDIRKSACPQCSTPSSRFLTTREGISRRLSNFQPRAK